MENLEAPFSFLLIPVALCAFLGLLVRRPTPNALLLFLQSAMIALYFWLHSAISSMRVISIMLLVLCLIMLVAHNYLEKTTMATKTTPSAISITLALVLFTFFALSFKKFTLPLSNKPMNGYSLFSGNYLGLFIVFFIILSILIAAQAIISSKNSD